MVGGSGNRLWPVSRKNYPKQFNKFFSNKSLFQETVLRFKKNKYLNFENPLILTNNDYRFIIEEQLKEIKVKPKLIIIEPEKKNTSPSILAASLLEKETNSLLLMVPSDHLITNNEKFIKTIKNACQLHEKGKLIIFGIKPSRIETGFGYIKVKNNLNKKKVIFEKFVEKPDLKKAKKYFENLNYFWNSGLILFRPKDMIQLFQKHDSKTLKIIIKSVEKGYNDLNFFRLDQESWKKSKNISIDYSILEKTKKIKIIKANFPWNDLGDWKSIWEKGKKIKHGVSKKGLVKTIQSYDSLIHSYDKNQVITAVGVRDLMIVGMKDAVLVANKNQTQNIKKLVTQLKNKKISQSELHSKDYRPWGNFESLLTEKNFHIKILTVLPGESLSLQKHKFRSENWVVVRGLAKVTIDSKTQYLQVGQSVFIPQGSVHRLENDENETLVIVEVQTGTYFGEDDIERFEDKYSR